MGSRARYLGPVRIASRYRSIQTKARLKRACWEEDTGREEGCREDARSQTAISLAGIGEGREGHDDENLSCQNSALRPAKFLPEQERQDESWRGRHECLRHDQHRDQGVGPTVLLSVLLLSGCAQGIAPNEAAIRRSLLTGSVQLSAGVIEIHAELA